MPLTSSVKELGAIKFEPGLIQVDKNDKHLIDFDGDADVLDFLTKSKGLGSVQRNDEKCSHKN
jgi:hypothetical protein